MYDSLCDDRGISIERSPQDDCALCVRLKKRLTGNRRVPARDAGDLHISICAAEVGIKPVLHR